MERNPVVITLEIMSIIALFIFFAYYFSNGERFSNMCPPNYERTSHPENSTKACVGVASGNVFPDREGNLYSCKEPTLGGSPNRLGTDASFCTQAGGPPPWNIHLTSGQYVGPKYKPSL